MVGAPLEDAASASNTPVGAERPRWCVGNDEVGNPVESDVRREVCRKRYPGGEIGGVFEGVGIICFSLKIHLEEVVRLPLWIGKYGPPRSQVITPIHEVENEG